MRTHLGFDKPTYAVRDILGDAVPVLVNGQHLCIHVAIHRYHHHERVGRHEVALWHQLHVLFVDVLVVIEAALVADAREQAQAWRHYINNRVCERSPRSSILPSTSSRRQKKWTREIGEVRVTETVFILGPPRGTIGSCKMVNCKAKMKTEIFLQRRDEC